MNLVIDIALWTIVVALGLTLFLRDQPMFADALRFARREFFALLPRVAVGMIGSGFIAEILPKQLIPSLLGPESGIAGLLFATVAGALTPGGPVVGFAIATAALKSGAGAPHIIAYTIAWALFALPRVITFEVAAMPARVVWLRVAVSLPLPFLAAGAAMLTGRP
ncbi:MAG: hypothetical protein WDO17_25335 [Alphaproteobacteria bacterium]